MRDSMTIHNSLANKILCFTTMMAQAGKSNGRGDTKEEFIRSGCTKP